MPSEVRDPEGGITQLRVEAGLVQRVIDADGVAVIYGWTPDGESMDTTVEVTFEDLGGKTRMVVAQSGFPTEEVRDFFATTAWNGAFDRIERYLALRASR